MKKSTVVFIQAQKGSVQMWTPELANALDDLFTSEKINLDRDQYNDLLNLSNYDPSIVTLSWCDSEDQLNFVFTWKIGSNSTSFSTCFIPYPIN